jgi:hypothetical protein
MCTAQTFRIIAENQRRLARSNERHRHPPALPDCDAAVRPGIHLSWCTAPIGPRMSIFAGESNWPSICACRGAQFGVR